MVRFGLGISADNNPHIAVYNTYNHGKRFVVSGIYSEDKVILDISYSKASGPPIWTVISAITPMTSIPLTR